MSRFINPVGPTPAKFLIIGDVPGVDDTFRGVPFMGTAGAELSRMLFDAGISRNDCRLTNLLNFRPSGGDLSSVFDFKKKVPIGKEVEIAQKRLDEEINRTNPSVIIPMGQLSLYPFIADSSISKWRGSLLNYRGYKVVPTYHPSQIIRNWEWRAFAVQDLKRANKESRTRDFEWPNYNFCIRPSFSQSMLTLQQLIDRANVESFSLSVDIETRLGFIACIGLAWSKFDAICIPLICTEQASGYFGNDEELSIILTLRKLLTHPNVKIVGQNFLYDAQYFAKEHGYAVIPSDDTMFLQHTLYPGIPKSLDFLASMYAEKYTYWKGEGKNWDPSLPEEELWVYNCKDACYTFEILEVLKPKVISSGFSEQYDYMMKSWKSAFTTMLRGVKINLKYRQELTSTIFSEIQTRDAWLEKVCGTPLNIRSPKQVKTFFYEYLALPEQRSRKGLRSITTDDDALDTLAKLEPAIAPICDKIQELRSLGVFLSTFVKAPLSSDNRIRCSFNPAGTETYRYSSSKDAFDSGTNLQNIPKGNEDAKPGERSLSLPNIRKLFIPDSNFILFDADLSGADVQVVAWEAEDPILKDIFRSGQKVHAVNAKDIFGGDAGPDGKREPYYSRAKLGCHLSNYGGKPYTLSKGLGLTVHEAENFQKRWFSIHPGILEWHKFVENELQTKRCVMNKFGFRRFFFDRIENLLSEALAWIPQSTVAIVTSTVWNRIEADLKSVQILLQVHDSLVGQTEIWRWKHVKPQLHSLMQVTVPYSDPLIIPFSLKTSTISWGDAQSEKWS